MVPHDSVDPRVAFTRGVVKGLAEHGVDVFLVRRALEEVFRRCKAGLIRLPRSAPTALVIEGDVWLLTALTTREALLDAVDTSCRRYLTRSGCGQRQLLAVLCTAVAWLPLLDEGQTIGEAAGVAS